MLEVIEKHPNYYISDVGEVFKREKDGVKKVTVNMSNGHARVTIDGMNYYVGRLVLEQFKPHPVEANKVFHIDGNYANNHLDNLVWLTPSEVQRFSSYTLEWRNKLLRARE